MVVAGVGQGRRGEERKMNDLMRMSASQCGLKLMGCSEHIGLEPASRQVNCRRGAAGASLTDLILLSKVGPMIGYAVNG